MHEKSSHRQGPLVLRVTPQKDYGLARAKLPIWLDALFNFS